MMTKIWERYFLWETVKIFFLILFCFYGLYVLVDYASHSNSHHYHHTHFHWNELFKNYYYEFILRLDVLIPFTLMIACIRTLCQLSIHNELIALMATGIKLKTLLRPFVFLGIFFTIAIYMNTEHLLPKALKHLRHIHDSHTLMKNKNNNRLFVQHVALKDHSSLLFQDYDTAHEMFFDAFWVKSFDDIYRIKYLHPYAIPPVGHYVDHLVRNEHRQLIKEDSFEQKEFPGIRFNKKVLLEALITPEALSISKLWAKLPRHQEPLSVKESEITTSFYKKLAIPWLCLLGVIGPAPFCVRFSRHLPVFFIFAFSIFGLVASYLIFDAAVVLGSRQVIPAHLAIGTPFALLMGTFLWRFTTMK